MIENIGKYCGVCSYFKIGEWNAEKGLFDHYCDVLDKNVSIVGYTCPDFKKRVGNNRRNKLGNYRSDEKELLE